MTKYHTRFIIYGCVIVAALNLKLISAVINYGRCVTPTGGEGSCIQLEDCLSLFQLLQSANLSEGDLAFLRASQCGFLNQKVLICCQSNGVRRDEFAAAEVAGGSVLPKAPNCGSYIGDRIIGGQVTHIDELPWMALIQLTKPDGKTGYYCGGSLINSRYVITAAHCVPALVTGVNVTGVRLGEWNTSTDPDCEVDVRGQSDCAPPHLDVPVEEVISHPGYKPDVPNHLHDIALLRLSKSIKYSYFVQPICLHSGEARASNEIYEGTAMDIAGWGLTELGEASALKLKATVVGSNWDKCRLAYVPKNISVESTQLCAGGVEGVDSCRGDSGGPLILKETLANRTSYYLAGITSFGSTPCGIQDVPGVYTRVDSYIDWIQNTIRD